VWAFKEDHFGQYDLALQSSQIILILSVGAVLLFSGTVADTVFTLVHIVLLISVVQF
jgi:hypothetical protein